MALWWFWFTSHISNSLFEQHSWHIWIVCLAKNKTLSSMKRKEKLFEKINILAIYWGKKRVSRDYSFSLVRKMRPHYLLLHKMYSFSWETLAQHVDVDHHLWQTIYESFFILSNHFEYVLLCFRFKYLIWFWLDWQF